MATPVLIIGRSGTGKSTSLRNCVGNDNWNLIRVLDKPLPFKGKINGWYSDDYQQIMKLLIASKAKNIVIDDGDYIYASFMQAYKIDLIEEQGRLPWKKFLYLFNGLPADTKIKQIMRIRQMPVPEYNGKNSKEIQEINEMKSYYTLPVEGGGGQSGLDLLFHTLEGMAKR